MGSGRMTLLLGVALVLLTLLAAATHDPGQHRAVPAHHALHSR